MSWARGDVTSTSGPPPDWSDAVVGADLVAGRRIGERYVLTREIDRGGVGIIFAARDEARPAEAEIAIKIVPLRSECAAERFRRELSIGRGLAGRWFVPILDCGEEKRLAWFAMELLHGEDLGGRLDRIGRLAADECAWLATELAAGLDAAHREGVVHRDLKPKNLFLSQNHGVRELEILDFGVAKQLLFNSTLTQTGTLVGSPYYMSPEQVASGRRADAAADLWSAGAVLYRCLVGQRPFDGEMATLLTRIAVEDPRWPTEVEPTLPVALDAFFKRALAKDPAARFPNGRALANAFMGALG